MNSTNITNVNVCMFENQLVNDNFKDKEVTAENIMYYLQTTRCIRGNR